MNRTPPHILEKEDSLAQPEVGHTDLSAHFLLFGIVSLWPNGAHICVVFVGQVPQYLYPWYQFHELTDSFTVLELQYGSFVKKKK